MNFAAFHAFDDNTLLIARCCPSIDKDFIIYTVVILTMIAMFFPYNGLMIIFENQLLGIPLVLLIVPGMATLISIVNKIKG